MTTLTAGRIAWNRNAVSPALVGFIWIVAVTSVYFALDLGRPDRRLRPATIVLLALAVRLLPAVVLPSGAVFDMESYRIVADLVRAGQDVYTHPDAEGRHPYLPFQMYGMALARWLALSFDLPFSLLVKLPAILADAAIAGLLYQASRKLWSAQELPARSSVWGLASADPATLVASLYALHPIALYVAAYHGQFDALPLLCALLAWYWLQFHGAAASGQLAAGLLLGLGVLDKTWPAVFLPLFLLRLPGLAARVRLAAGTALPVAAGLIVYLAFWPGSLRDILGTVLGYRAVTGWWGYTAVLNLLKAAAGQSSLAWLRPLEPESLFALASRYGTYATLAALGLFYLTLGRSRDLLDGMLTVILLLFTVTAGFGVQYLSWLVPLALLAFQLGPLRWYTGMAVLLLEGTYLMSLMRGWLPGALSPLGEQVFIWLLTLPVWLVTIAWLGDQLFRPRRTAEAEVDPPASALPA